MGWDRSENAERNALPTSLSGPYGHGFTNDGHFYITDGSSDDVWEIDWPATKGQNMSEDSTKYSTAHTPGPWNVGNPEAYKPRVRLYDGTHELDWAPDDDTEVYCVSDHSCAYVRADIADKMLAALKHAVAEWDYPAHALDKHAILAMRYAVTKAEEKP